MKYVLRRSHLVGVITFSYGSAVDRKCVSAFEMQYS